MSSIRLRLLPILPVPIRKCDTIIVKPYAEVVIIERFVMEKRCPEIRINGLIIVPELMINIGDAIPDVSH